MSPKTPTNGTDTTLHGDVFIVSGPEPQPFPTTLRGLLVSIFTDGPTWAKIVVAVVLILAGALGHKCVEPAPVPPAPVNVSPTPVNVTVQPAAPLADWQAAPTESKLTPRQRLFAERVRHRLAERLQRDGFALAGGDPTPLTRDQAERAVGKLTEAQVFGAAYSAGAWTQIGDDGGGLLGFIQRVAQWFRDHPEVLEAIMKILMSLLMFL